MMHIFQRSHFPNSRAHVSSIWPFLYHFMHSLSPNSDFARLSQLLQGRIPSSHLFQIHARVFRIGAHQDNLVATRLVGQYPSKLALRVFHHLQKTNLFPFNAIVRVLSEEGLYFDAFLVYKKLKKLKFLSPNDLTFSFLLKACTCTSDSTYVQQVHAHIVKFGFLVNSFVCNGLLSVYAKTLKDFDSACKLFDKMPQKDAISCWTCLISGYAKSGQSEKALSIFLSMVKGNLRPEKDTMVSVLSACSNLDFVQVENWIRKLSDTVNHYDLKDFSFDSVKTVLVYLYGKYGEVDKSGEMFDQISVDGKRSVVSWNTIIGAYVQNGCALEAISRFRLMSEQWKCSPNHITMVSVLSACAQVGDLDLGVSVHEHMKSRQQREGVGVLSNKNLATALIDMYSKCGSLERAREVFDEMVAKDVVSFNAMIMGLASNGEGENAVRLFARMLELNLKPNAGTFLGILCACSHSGLLQKGREMFKEMMSQRFSIAPKLEHYACYIDLLARMGCIAEALEVVTSMPFEPNNFVWGALLAGCLLHNKLELANFISSKLVQVDPHSSAGYVMLSNAFAIDHHWNNVSGLRSSMKESGVTKQPGCSWISIEGNVHEFLAGSATNFQDGIIHDALEGLLKEMKLPSA
ncbi:PREDICTED: pentatricopeptide repeat-containing protein At1g08070, chloroplastic-like [Ipomoea nil]|uniref:pentatricopeptide repeat-containing protein At1g08070, chloroplastic-like n=1 Tax=Ipomoea nil TaxID=35883 RepID=UPI00090084C6|nr:PREDICTED: pentatricopeptide repeat-containing protein At1g08070, chloroplastic-like [Ipomoea nil]